MVALDSVTTSTMLNWGYQPLTLPKLMQVTHAEKMELSIRFEVTKRPILRYYPSIYL
jgi:hypothetical protein